MPSSRFAAGLSVLSVVLASAAAHAADPESAPAPALAPASAPALAPAPALESAPAPAPASAPAHRTVLRPSKPLIAGGGTLFATLYLASALAASDGYDSPDGTSNPRGSLWIPAVGPFIMLGHTSSAAADVFLVLDGLGQLGGLSMLIYGIATPKTVLVPADTTARKLDVVPLVGVGGGGSGAAVVGSF
jgi:hypothetical protein